MNKYKIQGLKKAAEGNDHFRRRIQRVSDMFAKQPQPRPPSPPYIIPGLPINKDQWGRLVDGLRKGLGIERPAPPPDTTTPEPPIATTPNGREQWEKLIEKWKNSRPGIKPPALINTLDTSGDGGATWRRPAPIKKTPYWTPSNLKPGVSHLL